MQVVSTQAISGKKVLVRLDIDVPLRQAQGKLMVNEDFRLKSALPTLKLCLANAAQVIAMGHIGRPGGQEDPELTVAPIYSWLESQGFAKDLETGKLKLLENLRFESGEEACDIEYAKELALMGDIFVNEAFASEHPSASTTVLPTLLPSLAGLRFALEVENLTRVREHPNQPLIVLIGGVKLEDKLPAIQAMVKLANKVLVGGKIAGEIQSSEFGVQGENVLVGKLNEEGTDLDPETIDSWRAVIENAAEIIWNGPLGKLPSESTFKIALMILKSDAKTIVGGGDTIGFLQELKLLESFEKKGFVSTGGGAMLKFLTEGTLPSIEVLN